MCKTNMYSDAHGATDSPLLTMLLTIFVRTKLSAMKPEIGFDVDAIKKLLRSPVFTPNSYRKCNGAEYDGDTQKSPFQVRL